MAATEKTTKNANASTVRHIRIPDELFIAAVEKGAAEGLGAAELTRALYRAYVNGRVTL